MFATGGWLYCIWCLFPFLIVGGLFFVFIPQKFWPYLSAWLSLSVKDAITENGEFGIYPVLSAHRFFKVLTEHRMLYVRGPLGSGKSTLAACLCMFLLTFKDEHGRSFVKRVASNIPHRWPRPTLDQGADMSVLWFDELGLFLDSRSWGKSDARYWAGLRKLRSVIIGSSRIPVDKRLSELWCQRTTDFPFNYIKNSWFFMWGYESGDEIDGGMFFIYKPWTVWPFYPTSAYPTSDGGILDLLDISIKRSERLGVLDYSAFDFVPGTPLPDGVSKEVQSRYNGWVAAGQPAFDYYSSQFKSLKAKWAVLDEVGDLDELEGRVLLEEIANLHDMAVGDNQFEQAQIIQEFYLGQVQFIERQHEKHDGTDSTESEVVWPSIDEE